VNGNSPRNAVEVRTLLFEPGPDAARAERIAHRLNEKGVAASALGGIREVHGAGRRALDQDIAVVLDKLLALDLSHVLVACLRKHAALVSAAERTLAAPDSDEVVALATRSASATYSPHVDLLLDGVKVKTFEWELSVAFELTGLAAVVRRGELSALEGGDCAVTVALSLDGERFAEHQADFDPMLLVKLDPPLRLV
jgi:hypothetical protein